MREPYLHLIFLLKRSQPIEHYHDPPTGPDQKIHIQDGNEGGGFAIRSVHLAQIDCQKCRLVCKQKIGNYSDVTNNSESMFFSDTVSVISL